MPSSTQPSTLSRSSDQLLRQSLRAISPLSPPASFLFYVDPPFSPTASPRHVPRFGCVVHDGFEAAKSVCNERSAIGVRQREADIVYIYRFSSFRYQHHHSQHASTQLTFNVGLSSSFPQCIARSRPSSSVSRCSLSPPPAATASSVYAQVSEPLNSASRLVEH